MVDFIWSFWFYNKFEEEIIEFFFDKLYIVVKNFKVIDFGIYICMSVNLKRLNVLNVSVFIIVYVKNLGI